MKIIYVGSTDGQKLHKSVCTQGQTININPPFKLYLKTPTQKEYTYDCELVTLKNITSHKMYPRFGGSMKYEFDINIEENDHYKTIDFGEVYEAASLYINGEYIGAKIAPPYNFDIRGKLKAGLNKIQLEVTNTLVHQQRDRFSVAMPVEPSGLLGPVTIIK